MLRNMTKIDQPMRLPLSFRGDLSKFKVEINQSNLEKNQSSLEKSTKSLNILRCLSGTRWGANKTTLLTIYKATILALLDYCCFAYANAAQTNLNRLDTIQYKALLLVTGGIRGTALNALLGECAELPLAYRREKITVSYLLKIYQNKSNASHEVLEDKKYYQLSLVCKSKYKNTLKKFLNENNISLSSNTALCNKVPWGDNNKQIDLTFLDAYSNVKNKDPNVCKKLVDDILTNVTTLYENVFFVDGSVDHHGKVGAAILAPSLNINIKLKLPDHFSIYYAEGFAIAQALTTAFNLTLTKFCIITDNTKVLHDVKFSSLDESPHPHLISLIINLLKYTNSSATLLIKWLPGHTEHQHLLTVDSLAKIASSSPSSSHVNIQYSNYEARTIIDAWIWGKWLSEWKTNPKGTYQNTFNPSQSFLNPIKSRSKDVIFNRMRLLQRKLNSGLHKIGLHPSGQHCQHLIIYCAKTRPLRNIIRRIIPSATYPWDYKD